MPVPDGSSRSLPESVTARSSRLEPEVVAVNQISFFPECHANPCALMKSSLKGLFVTGLVHRRDATGIVAGQRMVDECYQLAVRGYPRVTYPSGGFIHNLSEGVFHSDFSGHAANYGDRAAIGSPIGILHGIGDIARSSAALGGTCQAYLRTPNLPHSGS